MSRVVLHYGMYAWTKHEVVHVDQHLFRVVLLHHLDAWLEVHPRRRRLVVRQLLHASCHEALNTRAQRLVGRDDVESRSLLASRPVWRCLRDFDPRRLERGSHGAVCVGEVGEIEIGERGGEAVEVDAAVTLSVCGGPAARRAGTDAAGRQAPVRRPVLVAGLVAIPRTAARPTRQRPVVARALQCCTALLLLRCPAVLLSLLLLLRAAAAAQAALLLLLCALLLLRAQAAPRQAALPDCRCWLAAARRAAAAGWSLVALRVLLPALLPAAAGGSGGPVAGWAETVLLLAGWTETCCAAGCCYAALGGAALAA